MVINILFPIVLLMLMGYSSVRLNLLTPEQIKGLGAFVIKIALPAFILHALASKHLKEIWLPAYVLSYAGGSLLLYGAAYWFYKKRMYCSQTQAAILSMGASMSNTGLIGSAILPLLIASHAVVYLSLTLMIENLLMITLVLLLAESGLHWQHRPITMLKKTLLNLIKTPLVIAIFLAFACVLFNVHIPDKLDHVLLLIGQTASPVALFVIGGSLVGLGIKAVDKQVLSLVLTKVVAMPLTIYSLFLLFTSATPEMRQAGTLIAALPMPIVFGIFAQMYGLERRALAALMLSTVLGFIGVSILILLWWS